MNDPSPSAGKKKFLAIMGVIAAAMVGSWLAIHFFVGFDIIEGFPLGLAVICADLTAFVIIGAILKKRLRTPTG